MPQAIPALTLADVVDHVEHAVFGTDACVGGTDTTNRDGWGVELEWHSSLADGSRPSTELLGEVLGTTELPGGGRWTIEPGGQVELSTTMQRSMPDAVDVAAIDLRAIDRACSEAGVQLTAAGTDPTRTPQRVLDAPRYAAMEAYFDQLGRPGLQMMCSTASVQVNIGLGSERDTTTRWRTANRIGPAMVAAFAHAPFAAGGPPTPSGWQSTRLAVWWALDPPRTGPVPMQGNPVQRYVDYALDAGVIALDPGTGYAQPAHAHQSVPFGRWMTDGGEWGWPTVDDLAVHLTTLFPPVRPKGWLELRYLDALPTPLWHVAVACVGALCAEPNVADEVEHALEGTDDLWIAAARDGLAHPALGVAAQRLVHLAVDVLERWDAPQAELVAAFADRWTDRGRSPADDLLDAWHRDGTLTPTGGVALVPPTVAAGSWVR